MSWVTIVILLYILYFSILGKDLHDNIRNIRKIDTNQIYQATQVQLISRSENVRTVEISFKASADSRSLKNYQILSKKMFRIGPELEAAENIRDIPSRIRSNTDGVM